MTPTLFANDPAERAKALDQRLVELIYCMGDGGLYNQTVSAEERAVLKALRHHTSSTNPVALRTICEKADLSERQVKDCIRNLRLSFRLPIGASRSGAGGGYWFFVTDEDRVLFRSIYLRQILSELEVLRAVDSKEAVLELLGQLASEVSK